jgi:DNA-binding NtrC family response regulator
MAPARTSAAELNRLLSSVAAPVYALSDERRIVYMNRACAEWLGEPAEQVIGRTCSFHSSPIVERLDVVAAGICPPPECFGGSRLHGVVSAAAKEGSVARREAEFIPLFDDGENCAAVLAIVGMHDLPTTAVPTANDDAGDDMSEAAALHKRLWEFHAALAAPWQFDRLVGTSAAMERVRSQVRLAAGSNVAVLIVGPSGSGRQHVAKAIHYSQANDKGRLVPLSCSNLGADLLGSKLSALLGHQEEVENRKRGGWTGTLGAALDRSTGTLLLNDVDDLPIEVQTDLVARLARTPESLSIVSTAQAPLDVRAARGEFLPALASALSTIVIHLPPLAERREDVPLLAQMFLEELNATESKQVRGFSPEALDQLAAYSWPGNIDELAEIVRQSHERAEGAVIGRADLPQQIMLAAAASRRPRREVGPIELEKVLAGIELELIERALRQAKGNKTKAARLLGLTRPRLYRRMVQLGLEKGN